MSEINSEAYAQFVNGTEYADNIFNNHLKVTIDGGDGDDSIRSEGVVWDTDGIYIYGRWGHYASINGGKGNDKLFGQAGNDYLSGGDGADTLSGGTGKDKLFGGKSNDSLAGGDGADTLSGDAGDAGNDKLFGDAGNDSLVGGEGADTLSGGAGNDKLVGGKGSDSLWGGAGNDSLYGGAGNDTFVYRAGEGKDKIFDYASGDMLTILKSNGKAGGTFTNATFNNKTLTFTIDGGGQITFSNVTKKTNFNINGTSYHVSGKTLAQ